MKWRRFLFNVKEYFTFSRRERTGILLLMVIIFFMVLVRHMDRARSGCTDHNHVDHYKKESTFFEKHSKDTIHQSRP